MIAVKRSVADLMACVSCTQDFERRKNMCPEVLRYQNGVSHCSLPRYHDGRCEPYPPPSREELEAHGITVEDS